MRRHSWLVLSAVVGLFSSGMAGSAWAQQAGCCAPVACAGNCGSCGVTGCTACGNSAACGTCSACGQCGTCNGGCCGGCSDGCCGGCCDECCLWPYGESRLFGLIGPSDRDFIDFVSPISNPLFFEDPRTLTELKPIFAEHVFPENNAVLQGGDAQYYALQFRLALTERLSIIAPKDSWINIHSQGVGDRDGFADTALGLKYNVYKNADTQTLLSAGLTYEVVTGQSEVFQGEGDGEFHFFLSGGQRFGENFFLLSGAGVRYPLDDDLGSDMFYWSNSLATRLITGSQAGTGLYLMTELNWFNWMRSGNAVPFNFEGLDLINFGSNDVAGNNILTGLIGAKWKPTPFQEIGSGVETALTEREDILNHRVYLHYIVRY
ncbi:MAG: hypothetical protein K1X74_22940 [Pirellulales bacterium]|nr:hypothetical protein [Pirellulales bacterium]